MFVPRQIQRANPKPAAKNPPAAPAPPRQVAPKPRPASDSPALDPTVAKELVLALEQLISSRNPHYDGLSSHCRPVDGHDDYMHIAAIIDCGFFGSVKPRPTTMAVIKSLQAKPSEILETSSDGYHLRLKDGSPKSLSDGATIYIEPYVTNVATHPGRTARLLAQKLPNEFIPILFTECSGNRAFVTLSSDVSEELIAERNNWPDNWVVMTKEEWKRRDTLYQELRTTALATPTSDLAISSSVNHQPLGRRSTRAASVPLDNTEADYETGLIMNITGLHSEVRKPTISSFLCRSVDRHVRKNATKRSQPPPATGFKINYIDYNKDVADGTAYVRLPSAEDADHLVRALKKRRRAMRDGSDGKGAKVQSKSGDTWVAGRVLEGDEEKHYWEKIRAGAGKRKGKGAAVVEMEMDQPQATTTTGRTEIFVARPAPAKRTRSSTGTAGVTGKKTKLDENE